MYKGHLVAIFLGYVMASQAPAAIPEHYDLSNAWFKPYLMVDRDSELCGAILSDYRADFAASARESRPEPTPAQSSDGPSERPSSERMPLDWKEIALGPHSLRVAEWQVGGRDLTLVRQEEWIGWRGPYYSYVLLASRLSEAGLTEENVEEFFTEHALGTLGPTGDRPDRFDVLTASDPRRAEYGTNTSISTSDLFRYRDRVYLEAEIAERSSSNRAIFAVPDAGHLELVCRMEREPTEAQLEEQMGKLTAYSSLEEVLFAMMGESSYCGTSGSHAYASHELEDALARALYRPWAYVESQENDGRASASGAKYTLEHWGYSGLWNHEKYTEFRRLVPLVVEELSELYARSYRIDAAEARELARHTLDDVLIRGFGYASEHYTDKRYYIGKMLLDGTYAGSLNIDPDSDRYSEESLLTFALKDPPTLAVLLEKGFDPNKANRFGKTPLMYAAQLSLLESAKVLVGHGAQLELTTFEPGTPCGYAIKTRGVSALHYAVRYASADFIEWLVSVGAPTFVKDSNGYTPADYLTLFGGFDGYNKKVRESFGEQNPRLSGDDREHLAIVLAPPSPGQYGLLSKQENEKAEGLYRDGSLMEAYLILRRSLALDPHNARALSNMSLVALRLGKLGESARAAYLVIGSAASDKQKASASFNLGLACKAARLDHATSSIIEYDGQRYCTTRGSEYLGQLHYFLAAYQLSPDARRRDAILELFETSDKDPWRRLCKMSRSGSPVHAIYVSGSYINLLMRRDATPPYKTVTQFWRNLESPLDVYESTSIALGDDYQIVRWKAHNPGLGALSFDGEICSRMFNHTYDSTTRLVEIFTRSAFDEPVRLRTSLEQPTILILYGNNVEWQVMNGLDNVIGIIVTGLDSSIHGQSESGLAVRVMSTQSVYPDGRDRRYTRTVPDTVGLPIDAIVSVDTPDFELTEKSVRLSRTSERVATVTDAPVVLVSERQNEWPGLTSPSY